ncbi:unnamed protein product [Adineta steineri]|uniref:Uncharacterized protein n=1 Tax=Adineta steineri TaxID=433720 RepID=A0A814IYR9_9BILA|nr:unnamed protein product [Adineta steineri]CAF1400941.1 unnamed protein product [Adineta steineri]
MQRFFPSKSIRSSNESLDMGINHRKRSQSRNKSLSSHIVSTSRIDSQEKKTNARIVRVRLVFIRIGEIDTLNEKYQADVYVEGKWTEAIRISNLNSQQQNDLLNENKAIRIEKELGPITDWRSQLYIENAIGQIGEQDVWFTITKKIVDKHETIPSSFVKVNICEHRRLKGVFWEKLELNHFPADVQDLTISVTTHHYLENCILVEDEHLRSSINREAFVDQQEWKLYEHVATESKQTKEEYSFQDDNSGIEQKKHPILAVTCRAARRPGYYYWNGFCLIFLITISAFCIFSIPPDLPQNRLQITCTLLLTSVTFRWVVNRSLPTISYLTTLDKYAIISIIMLVLLCVWHSIIASVIFLNPDIAVLKGIAPTNVYANVDRYICISTFICYIIIHIILMIWLICVPYKRRREMEYLDREYAANKHIYIDSTVKRLNSVQPQSQDLVFRRTSSIRGNLPLVKSPDRPKKPADGVTMIPHASVFLPIKEETNEPATKHHTPIELQEQDDVFYDHTNDINDELRKTYPQPMKNL